MSHDLGPGVSRVLDPNDSGYREIIFQEGKPPLDAEFNLFQELAENFSKRIVLRGSPSGFLGNETNPGADFITNPVWSNWFKFGPQRSGEQKAVLWAAVNGWLIPVVGTQTGTPPGSPNDTATFNKITLDPPPANSGDFRIDYVFLEVWQARIPPDPATTNKPASSAVYRYGNVEGGFSFLGDDLVDPAIGFETTQRVQLQYRVRVVKGLVGLTTHPDGFDPVVVKGQGAAADPTSFTFDNMRQELGDPGLWRSGDGVPTNAMGTVDGYSYAVPIGAIFRRNGVAWNGDPSQNLNGAFDRNPVAVDRTGIQTFSNVATLDSDISDSDTEADLVTADDIPLPITPASPVLIQIGDEIMSYVAVTTGSPPQLTGLARGLNGTQAEAHKTGDTVKILSGRPDGLFADQVAHTDILDLRHLVNPNGFDYSALLKSNLDRLLRGQLRANWKRSGAGPQGPFVHYQDKIATGSVSLGVTKLDAPDNIRTVFSDAATPQRVEAVITAATNQIPPAGIESVDVPFALGVTVNATAQATANELKAGDVLSLPVAQLKNGLPGGDEDQVRWVNDGIPNAVLIRVDGQNTPLDPSLYTVTPAIPNSTQDLSITLNAGFPTITLPEQLYLTATVMYGPGRGLSRRPDSLHSVSFVNPSTDLLLRPSGNPSNNQTTKVSWELLWSKFRNAPYKGLLPATSEVYGDLGSKSVAITPFRRVVWPTDFKAMDGTAANPGAVVSSGALGAITITAGSPTFTDAGANFSGNGVVGGEALVITAGPAAGRYTVLAAPAPTATTVTVERNFLVTTSTATYTVNTAQGLMPLLDSSGSPKWTTTDPLSLFSGTAATDPNTKNFYTTLPRHMVPGWGEVNVPILAAGNATFAQGINYMALSGEGAPPLTTGDKNYVAYAGTRTYQTLSTADLNSFPAPTDATFNTQLNFASIGDYAGIRQFTDTRGLGREGLELPPFYGIARLFGVFEGQDFADNPGQAFDSTTRASTGTGAVNLLRQDMGPNDGPVFWIEIDADGDSTFVLNANALDLSKSPNPIASFADGHYVIEASLFGFDRGSFDLNQEFRLVLTRSAGADDRSWVPANPASRPDNVLSTIAGPTGVLPGPATGSDQVVINYSRTPYQGDAWGSQTSNIDIPHQAGPLQSGTAFQLVDIRLDEDNLTRPDEKPLEVLASQAFITTLGTGRLSGDVVESAPLDIRNVGFEDPTVYPPTSAIDPRPVTLPDSFDATNSLETPTEYLGATERLPLGALFRDKDFRGDFLFQVYFVDDVRQIGPASSLAVNKSLEQDEVTLDTSTPGLGAPGDVLTHVDGEQGNYSLDVNFRTNRGGSLFVANGGHPGGEVYYSLGPTAPADHSNVIVGRAYLVRNVPTDVGANEVSAGSELMMLIVTTVHQVVGQLIAAIEVGTNGVGEGYSAADLYRIEGHPLVRDNVKVTIDPSTLALSKRP